ncbi:MAG: type II toxin-antitoxin system VapC family toxin [Calditrichia bacterium]
MNFLLDTHAFIWFINGDKQLPRSVIKMIENIENRCFISIASLWEISIKTSLGKLSLKSDFSDIREILVHNQFEMLPIAFEHLQLLNKLTFHHRDPFDRIIIAQGMSENLNIITKDENFSKYTSLVYWK